MKEANDRIRAMNFERKMPKAAKTERLLLRFLRCLLLKSILAFCILHFAFPPSASAQAPPQTENRFLFIINTSSAMRRMTNGIQQAVLGLLQSDLQGQMRDGDTFGIWTYDDQLHTGFPKQVWSKQNQNAIIGSASNYLAQSRYQNRPRLDKVLPAARQLIAQSRVITLIFVFDGSEAMQGTGFDKDINDLHNEFGREVRAENLPFVTVLSARDGKVFDYRVRTPSSASLPPTADLFKPAETNAVPSVAATNPPPAAVVASKPSEPRHVEIILKPTPSPQTNPPPVAASAPEPQPAPEKPEPALQPAPSANPSNPQSAVAPRAMTPAAVPFRNPQSPPPATASGEPPQQSPPNPALNPALNLNPNLNPNPRAIVAPEPPPPSAIAVGGTPDKSGLPAALPRIPPPPSTPLAMTPVIPPSNPQSAIPDPQSPPAQPAPPPQPAPVAVPTAVAMPTPSDHLALLVIAISLVTIAVVLVLFLIRRSHAAPSLISQSMDRPQ
jgi:hypothetical protein